MPNYSPTTSADLPLRSQFSTASRLNVSSNFRRSVTYGFGCLRTGLRFRLAKWGLLASPLFPPP